MQEDSTSKKILDSALNSLLKGLELSPWIKVPATFVAELSKRFKSLPSQEKQELTAADADIIASKLDSSETIGDSREFAAAIKWATDRPATLDHWYGLSQPAVDELITHFEGARPNVSSSDPIRTQVSQLIAWLESTEGPPYSELIKISSDF